MSLVDFLVSTEPSFRESRLPSLYSDLSNLRNTNPEGFAANAQAWTTALTRLAIAGNLPTEQRLILACSDNLLTALSSPTYGRPVGLGAVLDDALREGKMIDLSDFLSADKSIYAKTWIPSPWAVFKWSLRTAGLIGHPTYDKSGNLKQGRLVLVPLLEDLSKRIQAWQSSQSSSLPDRLYTRNAFSEAMASLLPESSATPIAAQDLDVLLLYLSRDNPILTYDSTTVKLKPTTAPAPEPLTSEDAAIANLKSLIKTLTTQVTTLETSITTHRARATTAVAAKNKTSALSALRSKKTAERALAQRTATLNQLEDVYTQIQQAADQVSIVQTLKGSAAALKTLNSKVGDVESVDAVLEELREEMQKTDEVQGVLNEPLGGVGVSELLDGEVDEELEAMEREERRKEEEAQAKETAARLGGLEAAERARRELELRVDAKDQVSRAEAGAADVDAQLSRSVDDMKELSLEDRMSRLTEQRTPIPEAA
jgi:charged multivesicular body protein 7